MRNLLLALGAVSALAGMAAAQTRSGAAGVIQARQASYKQIAASVKAISDQLRGGAPSLPVIRRNGRVIAGLAPRVSGWFPRGTGPEAGVRTRALPEIWTNPQDFRARSVAFIVAARRFEAATRGSDLAAIREANRGLANACRDCHDSYRGPEE